MNKLFLAATSACAAVLLSACATAPATSTSAATTAGAGNMYCFKDRLYTAGSDYVCNWTSSVAEACRDSAQSSRVAVSSLTAAPVESTRCASGVWLVAATKRAG
jgi:hypothetical protein